MTALFERSRCLAVRSATARGIVFDRGIGELGDPKTDAERLRRISPLFHAEQIKAPLMVLQGANDPRVLRSSRTKLSPLPRRTACRSSTSCFPAKGMAS